LARFRLVWRGLGRFPQNPTGFGAPAIAKNVKGLGIGVAPYGGFGFSGAGVEAALPDANPTKRAAKGVAAFGGDPGRHGHGSRHSIPGG
jgi:hypothetical protein